MRALCGDEERSTGGEHALAVVVEYELPLSLASPCAASTIVPITVEPMNEHSLRSTSRLPRSDRYDSAASQYAVGPAPSSLR
jgi:hypothetical protein